MAYFIGMTVVLPLVLAVVLLINTNSLLRRAAVFFMAAALPACAVWVIAHGAGVYTPEPGLAKFLWSTFMVGNFTVLFVTAWLGWRWKSYIIVAMAAIQAAMLCWIYFQPGNESGGVFSLDHLSMAFLLLADVVGPLTLLAAMRQLEPEGRRSFQPRFFASAAILLAAVNGLLLAGNLLWLLFFLQLGMTSAFFLLVHDRSSTVWKKMRNTIIINCCGGIAFIAGSMLCLIAAKTLILRELLMFRESTLLLLPVAFLAVAGFVGSALFPFQSRLTRACTANAQVSVMLQGAAAVYAGVYLILRLAPLFMNTWLGKILAVMGAFSFAAAALLALMQQETKRGLTYSTISTMGLCITLACLAELQAIYAAVLVAVLHGVGKSLLFLCNGDRKGHFVPELLIVFGALSMMMPPFGIPASLWTAIESAAGQPAVLVCLIAGSSFYLLFWTRLIGKRLANFPVAQFNWRIDFSSFAVHIALGVALILLSAFLVPLVNIFVAPILQENYSRFGDIAQAEANSFTVGSFSGVNPLHLFVVIAVVIVLGCVIRQFYSGDKKKAASTEVAAAEAAPREEPVTREMKKSTANYAEEDFWRVLMPWRQGWRKAELYADVFAIALIIVMFEVIAR